MRIFSFGYHKSLTLFTQGCINFFYPPGINLRRAELLLRHLRYKKNSRRLENIPTTTNELLYHNTKPCQREQKIMTTQGHSHEEY